MNIANLLIIIGFTFIALIFIILAILWVSLLMIDRNQKRHAILRNYPVLGRIRYFFEKIGPEMRQYWFNGDNEGKPFSRDDYEHIIKNAKYMRDVIGFGSKRDFEEEGFFVRNDMFPKLTEEMKLDQVTKVSTKRYILLKDPFFLQREEKWENNESLAYLLHDDHSVVIGPNTKHPFTLKGLIGMSAMSFGSLGDHAITALSEGLGLAKGTWMNTGEGGLSPYHLKGGVDIIMQIGPAMFGVRDKNGEMDWDELKRKSEIPQIKAFEIKLAEGAKTRGGHIDE